MRSRIAPLSPAFLTLLCSLALVVFYNGQFWGTLLAAMPARGAGELAFVASFGVLLVILFNLFLQAVPATLLRPVLTLALVAAAAISHFAGTYGTVIDRHMIASLLQTDFREARDLLSTSMALRLLLLGLLPSLIVWRIPLARRTWRRASAVRLGTIVSSVALLVLILWPGYQDYAFFLREHRQLGGMVNPATALIATVKLAMDEPLAAGPPRQVAGDLARPAALGGGDKPMVMVLVLGETARAANFSLNGYGRDTNPELAALPVISFSNVRSCGTSTAESVPCMFSHLGRAEYSKRAAAATENLLDIVQRAGLTVRWIENNSGCKGVCERVSTERAAAGAAGGHCPDGECLDEVLLHPLQRLLQETSEDSLIVLHMNGSHGPAYFRRYPEGFKAFSPTCDTSEIRSCSPQAVMNAYDNTIVYTDHVLASAISALQAEAERIDAVMLFVSDHGESLGESSTWLHGLPYAVAPDVQKHVPMIVWASDGYRLRQGLDYDCLHGQSDTSISHDHLFHSVLGLLGVRTDIYDPELDFSVHCTATGSVSGSLQAARRIDDTAW